MDSKFFILPTNLNYYPSISGADASRTAYKSIVSPRTTTATPDNRFPGWSAPMEDGRLVTDYRPRCAQNIPAGKQFASKAWVKENTETIIQLSRQRQAMQNGAIYSFDSTVVPPPEAIVQCEPTECNAMPTGAPIGLGVERAYDRVPELFGTFDFVKQAPPPTRAMLTQKFEGGRNSPRGREFESLGNSRVKKEQALY
jgi:hypothetical protein